MTKEKLKTLKDLNIEEDRDYRSLIDREELKAEAVKWVKEILRKEMELGNIKKGSKNNNHFNPRKQGQITFIKHFFNLTEEDLK